MQRGSAPVGGWRPRYWEVVEADPFLSPVRPRRSFYDLAQLLISNPSASFDELVAQLSASTLEDPVHHSANMAETAATNTKDEHHFWHPFPDYSRDAFFETPQLPGASIVIKDNYLHPGNPPVLFPIPRAASRPVILALDSLGPQLAKMDEAYNKSEHPLMDDIIDELNVAEDRLPDADDRLRQFVEDRMGYVQCVGKRTQAVLGMRNERPVDLPKMSGSVINKSAGGIEYPQHNYDSIPIYSESELDEQARALKYARDAEFQNIISSDEHGFSTSGGQGKTNEAENSKWHAGRKKTITAQGSPVKIPPPRNAIEALFRSNATAKLAAEQARLQTQFTPSPLLSRLRNSAVPPVNRITGAGLREFLTLKGQQGLIRKRECSSITFCDFTPHIVTGDFRNKMLGHWTATREKGERIEIYEVDLPTKVLNPQTGREEPRTQRWIWILISRPVLSLSATDTSTKLSIIPPKPTAYKNAYATKQALPKTAPTFPSPIPTSWIALACPLENVTEYSEVTEDITTSLPVCAGGPAWQKHDLRQDYDFSSGGIPIFEYSSLELMSKLFPKDHIPKFGTKFLSVENLGGYDPYDFCGHLAPQVYIDKLQNREDTPEKWEQNEYEEDREAPAGLQSPKSGIWWEEFFKKVDADKNTWEDIRSAMGRGRCRVAVRWSETETLRQTEVDLETGEVRPLSISARAKQAKKTTNKRSHDGEAMEGLDRSRKAPKNATRPRRKSKLATEVMTTSPSTSAEAVRNMSSAGVEKIKTNGWMR